MSISKPEPIVAKTDWMGCRDLFWQWVMWFQIEREGLPVDCLGDLLNR